MSTELKWGYVDNGKVDHTAIASMLDSIITLTPESDLYGTGTCRALIVTQSGRLRNSNYNGRLPLTIDIAKKVAKYTGGLNGVWKQEYAFDQSPNNQIEDFYDVDNAWQPPSVRDRLWQVGVIWAENYSRNRLFYPAFQTIYKDDSSILNSFPTIIACCQLNKFMYRAWTNISGGVYTNQQIIERSNRSINEQTDGRFHNRFVITPKTYFTKADEQRGYSYHCDVTIQSGNMVTVGQYTINAERLVTK